MVLVQKDPNSQEHVIYYLSKSLIDFETRYSRVEKLGLAIAITMKKICTAMTVSRANFSTRE